MESTEGQNRPATPSERPSRLSKLWDVFPSLFQSLVVAVVGFSLTGQVELALKDRHATLEGLQAIGNLLTEIAKEKKNDNDDARLDLERQLALYGIDAIAPLLVMGLTTTLPMEQAIEGLTLIAVRQKKEVCLALDSVLSTDVKYVPRESQVAKLRALSKDLRCNRLWGPSWFDFLEH